MTTMTRALVQAISADISAALADIAKKHGVALSTAGGKFDPAAGTATLKIEVAVAADGGPVPEGAKAGHIAAQADFKTYATMFGLKVETLGKTFTYKGLQTTVIGLMPNRRKYPVLCEQRGRNPFLLTIESLKAHFPSA